MRLRTSSLTCPCVRDATLRPESARSIFSGLRGWCCYEGSRYVPPSPCRVTSSPRKYSLLGKPFCVVHACGPQRATRRSASTVDSTSTHVEASVSCTRCKAQFLWCCCICEASTSSCGSAELSCSPAFIVCTSCVCCRSRARLSLKDSCSPASLDRTERNLHAPFALTFSSGSLLAPCMLA